MASTPETAGCRGWAKREAAWLGVAGSDVAAEAPAWKLSKNEAAGAAGAAETDDAAVVVCAGGGPPNSEATEVLGLADDGGAELGPPKSDAAVPDVAGGAPDGGCWEGTRRRGLGLM